jgi:hypothetical protein
MEGLSLIWDSAIEIDREVEGFHSSFDNSTDTHERGAGPSQASCRHQTFMFKGFTSKARVSLCLQTRRDDAGHPQPDWRRGLSALWIGHLRGSLAHGIDASTMADELKDEVYELDEVFNEVLELVGASDASMPSR